MDVLTRHARLTRVAMVVVALSFLVLYFAVANGVTTAVVAPGTFDQDINVQQNAGGIIVTWVTDAAEDGEVIFSLGDDTGLGSTRTDDRGIFADRLNQSTHIVTVTSTAGSTINYNIVSGGVADPNGPYVVTIPSTALTSPPDLLTGDIEYANNDPGLNCVVSFRVRLIDTPFAPNEHISLWSTGLSNGGSYSFDITNIRGQSSNLFFNRSKESAFTYTRGAVTSVIDLVARCDGESTASVTRTMPDVDTGTGFAFGIVTVLSAPKVTVADITVPEEGGDAIVTLMIDQVNTTNATVVNVATAGVSADGGGVDYTAPAATATIPANSLTGTITIPIFDDALDEDAETFTVTISDGDEMDGAEIGAQDTATVTITDDDDPPNISINDVSVTEGGTATLTVSIDAPSGRDVTFEVSTADDTATLGDSDYDQLAGAAGTIVEGQTQTTVDVQTTADPTFEADETLDATLGNVVNATVDVGTGTVTIENDDTVGTTADTDTTDEDTVLNGASVLANDDQLTVDAVGTVIAVNPSSPAKGNLHSFNPDGTFSFDPNGEFESLGVGDSEDVTFTYQAQFTGGGGVFTSAPETVTITVTGVNDPPVANPFLQPIEPGAVTTFDVRGAVVDPDQDSSTLIVNGPFEFTPSDTGVPSSLVKNGDETFTYNPGDFVGEQTFEYSVTDDQGVTSNQAEVRLAQGPTWKLTSNVLTIDEDDSAVTLTVELVNADAILPSTVRIQSADGTATVTDADYSPIDLLVSLGPASGEELKFEITLTIINDNPSVREGEETLSVEINTPSEEVTGVTASSVVSSADSTVDVTIDDRQDIPTITVLDATVVEGSDTPGVTTVEGGTYAVVSIVLTGRTLLDASVDWDTEETDGAFDSFGPPPEGRVGDYFGDGGTVEFLTGDDDAAFALRTRTVMIQIADDDVDEHAETFGIVLSNPVEANGQPFITDDHPDGTVTITDDDAAPSLKVINKVVNEGDGTITVEVELTGANTEGVSVDVGTTLGTATAGDDYDDSDQPQTLTWGPDESGTRTLSVDIIDDNVEEDAESTSVVIQGATLATATGDDAPTTGIPATIEDGSGLLTIYDNEPVVVVIGITSLGELLPGDWFFVAASDGDQTGGEGGSVTMSLLGISGPLEPLTLGDDGLSFLALAHDFDRIRSKITDGVFLGQVDDDQLEGLSTVVATVGSAFPQTTVNLLDARTNRNFFLWSGLNYTGLALVPDTDNDEFSEILAQSVRSAPAFHDRIMEVGGDRSATLADVVQTIFTYQGGLWRMYNTADPITGTPGGGTLTKAEPFQGMIIKTRATVLDSNGDDINVFDQVIVRDAAIPYDVPVRMNIRGPFIDSTTNSPLNPPSKVLSFGFNLIAPHIWDDTTFDTVFQGSGGDFRAIFSGAVSLEREATPTDNDGIDVDFTIGPVTESASSDSFFTLPGFLRPELAYWVRVSSGAPTLVATGPEGFRIF